MNPLSPGYLPLPAADAHYSLAKAGRYCGRQGKDASCARWARLHLVPVVPHFHPPGSRIIFRKEDIDQWLDQHRVEPVQARRVDLDEILDGIDRVPRHRGSRRQS